MPLYIVATPIGNLKDMTLRGLEVLKSADLIVCEDTRVSLKLLGAYGIEKPLLSIHQHSRTVKLDKAIGELERGKDVALITDAGTPGISDPGNQLVAEAVKNGIQVIPIPGTSTVGAMISVAGINMQKFAFLGFPPHKKGRETFFKEVAKYDFPVMYFDSTHRTIKNLELLESLAPGKNVILGRELTKMFEEIVRGSVLEVVDYFKKNPGKVKGEFSLIVY